MAKYNKLVEDCKEWIKHIRVLQQEYDELTGRARELKQMSPDDPEYDELLSDWIDAGDIKDALQEEEYTLYDFIVREYELVPFAATRNAGISGFYREAGLQQPR